MCKNPLQMFGIIFQINTDHKMVNLNKNHAYFNYKYIYLGCKINILKEGLNFRVKINTPKNCTN